MRSRRGSDRAMAAAARRAASVRRHPPRPTPPAARSTARRGGRVPSLGGGEREHGRLPPQDLRSRDRRHSFFGIAAFVVVDAASTLLGLRDEPQRSPLGLAITALSLLVMPSLAWAKRRVARRLDSV